MTKQDEMTSNEFSIMHIERGRATFCLLSRSPLIYHRFNAKSRTQLLLPSGRKTQAERAATDKHNPLAEYRDSVYRAKRDLDQVTRLVFPGQSFHKAIQNAALDLPGVKKAQIGRLCGVEEFDVSIYGVPQMFMAMVRNSDMKHTPDVRTRAILPQWACQVTVWFSKPLMREHHVVDLVAAAGIYIGIGDWRQEKGGGSYGLWEVVDHDDPRFLAVKKGARAAQDKALETPAMYDEDTEELYGWYLEQMERRKEQSKESKRSKHSKHSKAAKRKRGNANGNAVTQEDDVHAAQ